MCIIEQINYWIVWQTIIKQHSISTSNLILDKYFVIWHSIYLMFVYRAIHCYFFLIPFFSISLSQSTISTHKQTDSFDSQFQFLVMPILDNVMPLGRPL